MKCIICSRCKQKKQVRHHRYKQLISLYSSRESFKKSYICRNCKNPQQIVVTKNNSIIDEEKLQKLKEKVLIQAEWLHTNGIHIADNRDLFYKMLKNTLNDYFISDFVINILENKVHSVTLKKLPLINEYIMELKK